MLNFMWWKFLVLWRFFRLWAMWDGITVAGEAWAAVLYAALRGRDACDWSGPPRAAHCREHGALHEQQHVVHRILARLARVVQPVHHPVRAVPFAIPGSVRCARCSTSALATVLYGYSKGTPTHPGRFFGCCDRRSAAASYCYRSALVGALRALCGAVRCDESTAGRSGRHATFTECDAWCGRAGGRTGRGSYGKMAEY